MQTHHALTHACTDAHARTLGHTHTPTHRCSRSSCPCSMFGGAHCDHAGVFDAMAGRCFIQINIRAGDSVFAIVLSVFCVANHIVQHTFFNLTFGIPSYVRLGATKIRARLLVMSSVHVSQGSGIEVICSDRSLHRIVCLPATRYESLVRSQAIALYIGQS